MGTLTFLAHAWKNKSFSYGKNKYFIFNGNPFCAYFERYMRSPKIQAKSFRVIKDKICILKKKNTFVLSYICQKCQGTRIKAFLSFGIKAFNSKHKNAFIRVPWHFLHMHDKTKVSYIFKIQILSFMSPTLFARILGDSIYLSKCAQKG